MEETKRGTQQKMLSPQQQEVIMSQRDLVVYHQRRSQEEHDKLTKLINQMGLPGVDFVVSPIQPTGPETKKGEPESSVDVLANSLDEKVNPVRTGSGKRKYK